MSTVMMVSPQARLSYLAISAIVRRQLHASARLRPRRSHLDRRIAHSHRSEHLSQLRLPSAARTSSSYSRSDFSNQGFTGYYEPNAPTLGPLADASNIGAPRITPLLLKQHLDAFVVGQDRAKKAMATAVYNHYQRIHELQRRDEEEDELLAQEERRRMAEVRRHPVEGRKHELKPGIQVPSLTKQWREDEFPGQQHTVDLWTSIPSGEEPHPKRPGQTSDQKPAGAGAENVASAAPPPLFDPSPLTIEKSNILLLGPSGVGKTLMAKTLARVLEVPFSISDCTPFTQAGYIGEDAEVCVHRLLAAANYDVARAERGIICLDEIDKIATAKVSHGKDVSGEGVQQALLKIIEGTTLQIQAKQERGATPAGGGNGRSGGANFPTNSPLSGGNMSQQSPGGGGPGGKNEIFNVRTDNILFVCAGAFNGLHKMILDRISKGGIGFGATVRAAPGAASGGDSSMHETMLEGEDELFEKHLPYYMPPEDAATTNPTKRRAPRRFNTLDLVEPQDLQKFGLIPELVGRIPISCALSSLDVEALVKVLTEPRNSLLKQYEQLFQLSSIELRFTSPALRVVASTASKMGTGARGLRTVMERLLADSMFETPGSGIKHVLINEDVAAKKCGAIYFGRGQQGRFHAAIAAEEEAWEARLRDEDAELQESDFEKRARVNSRGGAARTFEEYREKTAAAGFV